MLVYRGVRERRFLPRLLTIALLLGLSACGGANSPSDTPTPRPGPDCNPGQYLNKDFPAVSTTRNLVFSQVTDLFGVHVLRMDVYEPVGDVSPLRPAIVWLFGGNFKTGDRDQLSYFATEFALRGYVTATIDYRKLRMYERVSEAQAQEAAQSDAQAAIRFLRSQAANYSLDTARLGIGGWSAGSITSFNVGYRSEFVGDNVENIGFAHTVGAVVALEGFSLSAGIQAHDPPFVLFRSGGEGGPKPREDPNALPTLIAQAEAAGIPYEIKVIPGTAHPDLIVHPYDQMVVAGAAPFLRTQFACR